MVTFAWLDFSETDRQRALDVIDAFREKGTVDELGIGTVRDAIADLLFPGTSTIMTRARYYLFIPWIYLRHERKKTGSSEIGRLARQDEIRLIEALAAGGETLGVMGIEARKALKRLPSTVYWQGLGILGIRKYAGSIEQYHRDFESLARRKSDPLRGDDKQIISGGNLHQWHPAIPPAPVEFPRAPTTLTLSPAEADFLRERVMHSAPHSLLAWLVNQEYDRAEFDFPWDHPRQSEFTPRNRDELSHARNFAECMHGAALLYNLMIAQKNCDVDRIEQYENEFDDWASLVEERESQLARWDRAAFWRMVLDTGRRIPMPTQTFVRLWFEKALSGKPRKLATLAQARAFIAAREKALKGPLSRLDSNRSLNWGGASSSTRLDYRWKRPVRNILRDIREPLD